MIKRKPKTIMEITAIALVASLCFIDLLTKIESGFAWSIITTTVGLVFLICFLLDKKIYNNCLFAWALLQTIVVSFPTDLGPFDLGLVFNINLGLNFDLGDGDQFKLGVNPLGIIYFALALRVKLDYIFGVKFKIVPLKSGTLLDAILPGEFEVLKRNVLGDEKSWFLIKRIGEEQYCLIRGKDVMFLESGKNLIVKCLIVTQPFVPLNNEQLNPAEFKSGAWAVIK